MKALVTGTLMILALGSVTTSQARTNVYHRGGWNSRNVNVMVPAGTSINVQLNSAISTDNAHQGDSWTGTVSQSIASSNGVAVQAGSPVEGVVTSAVQGTHSTPAQLALAVRRVTVNGQSLAMNAESLPIVAGTSRAKKIGAIAGGAAVGALLGHTVAKGSHGTLIGGLLGGAAGYGLTRNAFRTLQLKSGTVVSFTTSENLVARQ
jgi:hypothetical protein